MDAEVKIMHKLKKLILLILSISIAPLYLMFSNSTEIEASSNDNNSINYLKLKNKSTYFRKNPLISTFYNYILYTLLISMFTFTISIEFLKLRPKKCH